MTVASTLQRAIDFTWHLGHRAEQKASRAGKLISLSFVGQPIWTPRQYDKIAEESYGKNAVAYRAIAEIGKCAGSVPFQLFERRGGKKVEIDDPNHPLLRMLSRPNPLQNRAALMQAVTGFLLIAGNSYLERVGPEGGAPRELWPKRPDRMKVIAGKKGIPGAYQFSNGGQSVEWPVRQRDGRSAILHLKTFHPLNDWYGMSPIEAAAFAIDQHNEAGKWNMALLQNSARPSGALIVDPKSGTGLDDTQYVRLRESIREEYSGPGRAGLPMLLEGGLDWKEMSLSPREMDWIEGKHTSARDVAMVLGMPAQMLGIPGDNTHRNMEEARLWLWEQTIIPILDQILQDLNWWLTPLFGDNIELAFDLDEVPALITRRYMLWDKINKSDFLTLDEKRRAVRYENLPKKATEEELEATPGRIVLVPTNRQDLGDLEEEPEEVPVALEEDPKKPAIAPAPAAKRPPLRRVS